MTDDLCTILYKEADRLAPEEMCGLIFDGPLFVSTKNISLTPTHSFLIDSGEYTNLLLRHGEPWAIVHSHPGERSNASGADCRLMDTLQASAHRLDMVIVGLNPRTIRVYRKQGDRYTCLWHQEECDLSEV